MLVNSHQEEAGDGVLRRMVMADGLPVALEGLEDGTGLASHPADPCSIRRPIDGTLLPASARFGEERLMLDDAANRPARICSCLQQY